MRVSGYTKPSTLALKAATLAKRVGLSKRTTYRQIVNCIAPDEEKAIRAFRRANPFVIVSTGRTATKWLARLLNRADGAYVAHEPVHRALGRVEPL